MSNQRHHAVSTLAAIPRIASLIATAGLWAVGIASLLGTTPSQSAQAEEPPSPTKAPDLTKPKPLTADEQTALVEFQKLYRLDQNQVVKYISHRLWRVV